MNITAILSGIVAIARAIPQIKSIFDDFVRLYIDAQIKQAKKEYTTKEKKTRLVLEKIRNAKTNEERQTLSVILDDVINS